jgi:hypothetical protein
MPIVYGSPFKINWTNKEAVIAYAKKLGPGQLVYKDPSRPNFNIMHSTRWKEINPAWVIFETTDGRREC